MKLLLIHFICIVLSTLQMLFTYISQGKLPVSQRAHQSNEEGGRRAEVLPTESLGMGNKSLTQQRKPSSPWQLNQRLFRFNWSPMDS